jgi:hypothetical protein
MRKLSSLVLASALLISVTATPVMADDWHRHGDIHDFHDHGFDHWRGGRWISGFHEGRNGWWWVVDGFWYYYPAPVYPYPDPYMPPNVVVETAPGAATAYYYCTSPAGYYPYVPRCAVGWQRVVSAAPAPQVVTTPAPQPMPAPTVVAPAASLRDIDLRQLNAYAAQLQAIDLNDPHARARLKDLNKKVEAFRQSLYKKSYNAMDLLRDADDLKNRIAQQRAMVGKHVVVSSPAPSYAPPGAMMQAPAPMPSAPMAAPATPVMSAPMAAPAPVPAGTTVTFPPQ